MGHELLHLKGLKIWISLLWPSIAGMTYSTLRETHSLPSDVRAPVLSREMTGVDHDRIRSYGTWPGFLLLRAIVDMSVRRWLSLRCESFF